MVERGRSVHTVAAYRRDLARYLAHLQGRGRTSLGAVTAEDVDAFVVALRTGDGATSPALAPASTARAVAAVRGWHRYVQAQGWAVDVAADRPAPRPPGSLPRALTVDAVGRLLAAPDPGTPTGLRDRALMETLYATGTRISEAVGLDLAPVRRALDAPAADTRGVTPDGEPGAAPEDEPGATPFVLVTGKGERQRYVPLGSHCRQALHAYLVRGRPALVAARRTRAPLQEPLFLNARGARLSRQSAFAVIAGAARVAGLPEAVSPHVLRHSFATHLVQGGADVRVVQELLGHASLATTQVYTRVTVDALREVYATSHPRALG